MAIDPRVAPRRERTWAGPAMRAVSMSACLALLAACGAPEKARPVAVQAVVQRPGQASITVSERQSGAAIVLERTQALRVRLPTDVTSGRDWALIDLQPGVLAPQGSKVENGMRGPVADEYVGAVVWRFVPQAPGTVTLTFELRRPHRVGAAAQTVTYRVTVK